MGFNTVNGCGACSGFWRWFKPPHYKFFNTACYLHNKHYEIGGTSKNRFIADYILLRLMLYTVKRHFKGRKALSKIWYILLCICYFIGVRFVGFTRFNYKINQ